MGKIHKERLIYKFIDGMLDERGTRKLLEHLEKCEDCRIFMEKTKFIRGTLLEMKEFQPGGINWEELTQSLNLKLRQQKQEKFLPDSWAFFWKLSLVTIFILMVFGVNIAIEKYREGKKVFSRADENQNSKDYRKIFREKSESHEENAGGFLTFIAGEARFSEDRGTFSRLDINSSIKEGTVVETMKSSCAGIQMGRRVGLRIEESALVKFRETRNQNISLDLQKGSISVDYKHAPNEGRLYVYTEEAVIKIKGTLFSVSRHPLQKVTSVVVSRGTVEVKPAEDDKFAVDVKGGEGIKVYSSGKIERIDEHVVVSEKERLDTVLFNFFPDKVPQETLTLDVKGGDFAFIDIGGKKESSGDIIARMEPGTGNAKIILKDGAEVPVNYNVAPSKGGSMVFDLSKFSLLSANEEFGKRRVPENQNEQRKTRNEKANWSLKVAGEEETEEKEELGFIDPFIIKMKILKEKGALRSCYEKYLVHAKEAGIVKAKMNFKIGSSGKVVDSSCNSSVEDKNLCDCLQSVIRSIVFPAPEGGVVKFEYPITFAPK